jgi:uncharacterized protein
MPTIAIIGASRARHKFGNKAVRVFADEGFQVFPIHPTEKEIEGHRAYPLLSEIPVRFLDRVSFYVPSEIGITLLEEVAKKAPKEVWLNPGSESDEMIAKGKSLGLKMIAACSIVAIGRSPSDY